MAGSSVGKLIGLEIKDDLLAAISRADAKGRDGLTILEASELLDLDYYSARTAVVALVGMGVVKWGSRGDRNVLRIVLPDWQEPAMLDLTGKQWAVFEFLASQADAEGLARCSFRDICKGASYSKGGIVALIDALDRKGYIEILERGRGTTKTLSKVYPKGDGPRDYSPMKPLHRGERPGYR